MKNKSVYMTMDIENDYTYSQERHYGLFDIPGQFEKFCDFIQKHDIKLTGFVVGNALIDRPDYIRALEELGVKFGSHSLTHDLNNSGTELEVRGGIDAFVDFFGYLPAGYRSPRGVLTPGLLEILQNADISYDSSIYPSYRYNVYSHLDKPVYPFRWQGTKIMELPIGVMPKIRIPLALSYVKIIGRNVTSSLMNIFGNHENIVFLLHPMDIVFSDLAFKRLSKGWQFAYSINRKNGWSLLGWLVEKFRNEQFEYNYLHEYYEKSLASVLPEISLNEL